MIRIPRHPAPHSYNQVRDSGALFLNANPHPTNAEFKKHNYWRWVHQDLYDLYAGICAYCSSYTVRAFDPSAPNHSSVDHFLSKSSYPELAYGWTNFRLARRDVNENKGNDNDIVDPFAIEDGWFQIDFTSCRIKSDSTLPSVLKARVVHTITQLKLNEPPIIDERTQIIGNYAHDRIPFLDLRFFYPFIAQEMVRQNFDANLKQSVQAVHP